MHTSPTPSSPQLATRFARNTFVLRSEMPLAEDQMRQAAPSIFAAGKHASRSERYTYIPTIEVLRGLRREGFEPFMVAQSRSRIEGKTEYTKHMIRLRHLRDVSDQVTARSEANEIILINRPTLADTDSIFGTTDRARAIPHRTDRSSRRYPRGRAPSPE
jgi:hypothetical protein